MRLGKLGLIAAIAVAGASDTAAAAPWPLIDPVTSQVYETPGDVKSITSRGATCMARVLKPGVTTAATILSTDLEGGRVVARHAYETPGILGQPMPSRAIVTFEAKEGRFRIVFTDMEEIPSPNLGWQPVRGRKGPTDAPRTISLLLDTAWLVAKCVKAPVEDW